MIRFTNQKHLIDLAKRDPYWKNWDSWKTRWEYMAIVQAWMQFIEPDNILEAGCNNAPLCIDSDTVGLAPSDNYIGDHKYIHDLTSIPWPFADKQYDIFVALQVWEHLNNKQHLAFQEAKRIAHHVILSFPYMWNTPPEDCHHSIDESTIVRWANGQSPNKIFITNITTRARLVCYWKI